MIGKIFSHGNKFDIIIIGGGATGIGVLLEAVSRGYSAALFESTDFTKSTSGKSTKLVHGGVRYLAQGNIGLVREACIERGYLYRNAPHIVKNLSFIIPVYSFYEKLLYTTGLIFYDLLSGKQSLGPSRSIDRKRVSTKIPQIKKHNLKAGVLYHDGQFDDSRLAIATLQTAAEMGGIAVNYMKVTGLLKNEKGRIRGVNAINILNDREIKIESKIIVNATGVFADEIMELDKPGHIRTIRPSQGVHLVVDKKFLQSDTALMIPKTGDGRVLFAVPWLSKVILGTTDTPVDHPSLEPVALEEEIDFILNTAGKYLECPPRRKDVLSVFAGLRPLAETGDQNKTKEVSRSHKIIISGSGLYTLIGGKWTTFRKMASDLINRVEKKENLPGTKSVSHKIKIKGYLENPDLQDPLCLYGSEVSVLRKISSESGNSGMVSDILNLSVAEIVYAVRHEMALKLEDVLARRTRALLLDANEAFRISRKVAQIMAREKAYNSEWVENEVKDFYNLSRNYVITNKDIDAEQ